MRLFLAGLALACVSASGQSPDFNWIAPSDARLEINGLPWHAENGGEWFRLPLRLKDTLPEEVWRLGQSPSGGRIRFRTDSGRIAIRLEYPSPPIMRNMHAFGETGVDLYVDGAYRGTAIAATDSTAGAPVEHVYFCFRTPARAEHEITLYLALYKPVKVLGVGLEKDARLSPATPFALARPIVFYGTSITQGGCASRSGMSYQAILGRMLNADFVNLGFSGNGKGEPEVARMVAEIDASCFVLDFAQNNKDVKSLREVYEPFMKILRDKHPDTPMLAITPIASASERAGDNRSRLEAMREHIRAAVSLRMASGDRRLQLVEGTDLLGPDRLDGLVDGTHPNDLGFQWMAEGLAPRLKKMLEPGLDQARHVVLVAGDQEYRSEELMPALAPILAERHGFKCTVLFTRNRETGAIDPAALDNLPGLEALRTADLMVMFARFLELPDAQMKEIVDYTNSGRPMVGLRTSTHPFNYRKNRESPYAIYSYDSKKPAGGYGRLVFGETWISHYGVHQKESTRGIVAPGMEGHPILRGVKDIWGESDVYTITALAGDSKPLVLGQVLAGMDPSSPPNPDKKLTPVAWTKSYTGESGKTARVFTTTMGHPADFKNQGFRRLVVNGCYWALGLEDKIAASGSVELLAPYNPNPIGIGKHKKGP